MNTSDVLNLAADLIEERGWQTGPFGWENDRPLCLEGAIAVASDLGAHDSRRMHALYNGCAAYNAVARYLELPENPYTRPCTEDHHGFLWMWNDNNAGSQDRVVEVLRAAAVVEAARESQPSVAVA